MSDPGAYEVINPDDFGVTRHIEVRRCFSALSLVNMAD
jgi:hypothetical protein